ncbi:GIY-YIG nuclease family protein [Noviherbaspirillum galbum]|uniref:GIY-YIG nuclease family protein n=1 Tax=Noviherbaspirillum galbum TaxID=2709383 RepID=A0A6B3SHC6_9BURK|nr:GIY-YIG nuclease family protein [Noviherbaspirillum galbum]NEX60068.1 GIY-YIG nuclease family protein [Noviherbaspirillum galbum]
MTKAEREAEIRRERLITNFVRWIDSIVRSETTSESRNRKLEFLFEAYSKAVIELLQYSTQEETVQLRHHSSRLQHKSRVFLSDSIAAPPTLSKKPSISTQIPESVGLVDVLKFECIRKIRQMVRKEALYGDSKATKNVLGAQIDAFVKRLRNHPEQERLVLSVAKRLDDASLPAWLDPAFIKDIPEFAEQYLDLTSEEINFLERHDIAAHEVLDATLMNRRSWMRALERLSMQVALVRSPCNRGHRLKRRAGHCVQCDSKGLSWQRNHNTPGYVYLAYSESERLIKVGITKNAPRQRLNAISRGYGKVRDWKLIDFAYFPMSKGRIEEKLKAELKEYREQRDYQHSGKKTKATEIFDFPLDEARSIFEEIANREGSPVISTELYTDN